jgi:Domain of unknown function (DUF4276)
VKLILYVEGDTEKEVLPKFLRRWLDPRLENNVGIAPVNLDGVSNYLKEFANRAQLDLGAADVLGCVGIIDLYGSGLPYSNGTIETKYKWAKDELEKQVGHPRFRQHFAVHETEAWLLSEPQIFPRDIVSHLPKTPTPERVNFQDPPSYRLKELYWQKLGKKYKKPIEGSRLFQKLDPEVACTCCPHLRLLLEDILTLARTASS